MAEGRRILYVDLAAGVGGSLVSLALLVRALDRGRYEPVVALVAGQPYAATLAQAGARVLTVPARANLVTPGRDAPLVAQARASALAAWLRRGRRRAGWLHAVGFLARNLPPVWATARALQALSERERPALLHLNDALPLVRAGVLAARRAGVPCLAHVRSFTPLNEFDRWLARRVDGYIFISEAVAAFAAGQAVRPRRSWVIPNGVELSAFDHLPPAAEARAALDLPAHGLVVGTVGRLVAWKGHQVFLHALAALAPHWPALQGVVVGAPEGRDPRPLEELRTLAAELGLSERVHFLGHRGDVPQVLAAFDLLVHAAVEPEPFGRVIIEGLAARLPVVAANAGAVPEIIADGETGLLVAPGDAAALARAIDCLLSDRALAARLAGAGRRRVEEQYTAQATARAVERAYEEVLCCA